MSAENSLKLIKGKLKDFIALARPSTWFVTVFTLTVGAMFAVFGTVISIEMVLKFLFLCFVFAHFIAGGLYVLNDVNDRKMDRQNPEKADRPIASGRITPVQGLVFSLILLSIGCFLALQISFIHFVFALALIFLQIIYSVPPVRLKESSIDLLFSGPLNHMIRFAAAWILFKPAIQMPIFLITSLFILYSVSYLYYKLIDKEITPKKSVARNKNIQIYLDLAIVSGILLMFVSAMLNEISFLFVIVPVFISLIFITQKMVPATKRLPLFRSMFYRYGPFCLIFMVMGLWMLAIVI